MASQDQWARPLAKTLVDLFRVTGLDFIRRTSTYDPATGVVTPTEQIFTSAGAVVKTAHTETDPTTEQHDLTVWVCLADIDDIWPTPEDQLAYEGARWRITSIDPAYGGDTRYAAKLMARRE